MVILFNAVHECPLNFVSYLNTDYAVNCYTHKVSVDLYD